MELSANFAMTKNIRKKNSYGYNFLSIHSQLSQHRYSDLPPVAIHSCSLGWCSWSNKGSKSLSLYNLIPTQMTKNNGIKASVKYSSTTFTLSHETAKNQFSINPTLLQMLYHASKLFLLAETHFKHLKSLKVSHDVEQHIIGETADTAGEIINQIGSVIGIDMAEQGFNLK